MKPTCFINNMPVSMICIENVNVKVKVVSMENWKIQAPILVTPLFLNQNALHVFTPYLFFFWSFFLKGKKRPLIVVRIVTTFFLELNCLSTSVFLFLLSGSLFVFSRARSCL